MTVSYKQLADEVSAKSRIIEVEESVINQAERPRLITLTESLIIWDIAKTNQTIKSCFVIHYFEENNSKLTCAGNRV